MVTLRNEHASLPIDWAVPGISHIRVEPAGGRIVIGWTSGGGLNFTEIYSLLDLPSGGSFEKLRGGVVMMRITEIYSDSHIGNIIGVSFECSVIFGTVNSGAVHLMTFYKL